MEYICASKLTTIGPNNVLSLGRRQAIIWTNAGILLISNVAEKNLFIVEISLRFTNLRVKIPQGPMN